MVLDHSVLRNVVNPPPTDNQVRLAPRLPGSSMPARGELPLAYIYQPAPSPTQSGRARKQEWVLEFEPWSRPWIEPLMGWTGSRDPLKSIPRLRFPDRESAIEFAERQGWRYVVRDPPSGFLRPKSYVDRFRYELAGAIDSARWSWDGAVSIACWDGAGRGQPRAGQRRYPEHAATERRASAR